MRICDLTLAYTETSGGIRTYIDRKREHLLTHTPHEHVLIIPGEEDGVIRQGRATTVKIASPMVPGCEPYRFFWRPDKLLAALRAEAPDVVELGSYFVCPGAAFRYREERIAAGRGCLVAAYFHTDVADAYFAAPVRGVLADQVREWSEPLADVGMKIADVVAAGATAYFGGIFQRCDLLFAATATQAERVRSYGVESDVAVVPLGVDLDTFHPRRRDPLLRTELGASGGTILLAYAGRMDVEKNVALLVAALDVLNAGGAAFRLVMAGNGPERAALEAEASGRGDLVILPYQSEPAALARLLASADIYVTAGPHETFGLAVIEAQAAGCPVAGVRAGALVERVPAGIGRLAAPGDAADLARAVAEIVPDRTALGRAARRHVEENGFGWENSFRQLLRHYEGARREDPIGEHPDAAARAGV